MCKLEVQTKLYHGTTHKHYDVIRKFGITPRGKKPGNWEDYPSRNDMVYLSMTYPFYFSVTAIDDKEDDIKNEKVVVFETELCHLDHNYLYPDEDFIWQAMRGRCRPKNNKKLDIELHCTVRNNIEDYREMWSSSLIYMGNCAYQNDIHPTCFTRCCTVDFSEHKQLAMEVLNPSISILNHRFCSKRYQKIIAWFFGDIQVLPQVADASERIGLFPEQDFEQAVDFWTEESNNRKGIKVENCRTWKDVWDNNVEKLKT